MSGLSQSPARHRTPAAADVNARARSDHNLQVRLDADLHERLKAEADERDVPLVWIVNRLLREGVEQLRPAAEFTLTRKDDR